MFLPDIKPATAFVALALVFGVATVFITPPFQVPDEVGHFWHSYALARGEVFPNIVAGRAVVELPQGARDLVATLWIVPGTRTNFEQRLASASRIPYSSRKAAVKYPVLYSPVPYIPQAIGCFVGDALQLRPLVTFYIGRLATLLAVVFLVVVAIRFAGEMGWIVCLVGALPMSMFLFASYSADALTIALSLLVFACARDTPKTLYPAAFALGLCKPPYLLITLLVFARRRWRAAVTATAAAIAGGALAAFFACGSFSSMRPEADTAQQMRRLRDEPTVVLRVVTADLVDSSPEYLHQLVGRLGWLDIDVPRLAYYSVLALLLLHLVYAGQQRSAFDRLAAAGVFVACVGAIELSDFITWTPPAAAGIQGVQGRYFVPLLPLFFFALGRPARVPRWLAYLTVFGEVIASGAGAYAVHQRYFG